MPRLPLQSKLDGFCVWYKLTRCWALAQDLAFAAISVLALMLLVDRLFFLALPCSACALSLAMALLLALLGGMLFLSRREPYVSYLVDKSAGLKNLVSSALDVAHQSDEVASAVTARARAALASQSPYRAIPPRLRWTGRYVLIPALLLAGAFFLPSMDLLGRQKAAVKAAAEREALNKGSAKLMAKLTSIQDAPKTAESIDGAKINKDFNLLAENFKGLDRQDALLQLGQFENKYRKEFSEHRQFEQAAKALQQKLDTRDLPPELQKKLKDLLNNFKDGNFKNAADAMRDLARQLQDKNLSPEARQALARELAKMMEKSGNQAGLNKDLAKMLRDIEASPQDLEKMLQKCEQAGKEMSEMADFAAECDSLKAMAEGLKDAKKAMLGDQSSPFDPKETEQMMEAESEAAKLGMGQGQGEGQGLGEGQGQGEGEGEGNGQGGTGGRGQGRGGTPLENRTDTAFKKEFSQSKIGQGRILHQLFVTGVPEKGEAAAEYEDVLKSAKQQAASSLARDQVPRESEQMIRSYFDSLELQTKSDKEEKANEDIR